MREIDALKLWQEQGPTYFRELSTLGALSDEAVLRLLQNGRIIELSEGECLYEVGDPSDAFYIILKGSVDTLVPKGHGEWTLTRCHKPGDDMGFVPMIALTNRRTRTWSEKGAVVVEVSCDQFFELHQQEPDTFGLMLLNLARGMARAIQNMATMLEQKDSQLHKAFSTPLRHRDDQK